jgi:hypothetical protein
MKLSLAGPLVSDSDLDAHSLQSRMEVEGVVRLNRVLSVDTVLELRTFIIDQLAQSIKQVESDSSSVYEHFSSLLSSSSRWDFKLPYSRSSIVDRAIREALRADGPLGSLLEKLVSPGGELFELAAFYTLPGCNRQVVHADTLFSKKPVLYTGM